MTEEELEDVERAWEWHDRPEYGWRRMDAAEWNRFGGLDSGFGCVWEDPCFFGVSGRKWRLFASACCRRIWHHVPNGEPKRVLETMERIEDGSWAEWELVRRFYDRPEGSTRAETSALAAVTACCLEAHVELARTVAQHCRWAVAGGSKGRSARAAEEHAQCDLLRELVRNPFRAVPFNRDWRTGTAVLLARGMYEARAFHAMPILADALQDAGCEDAEVLDHCRGPGPHVRGCWVVDLVLGKE